tara:strand:- start:698 stop:910 length:213 start_codon:yes stop_codon:yes gene_type:complete
MLIKEYIVSKSGISCIDTIINSNIFSVNNILFYITMRTLELAIRNVYETNKTIIENIANNDDLICRIAYS